MITTLTVVMALPLLGAVHHTFDLGQAVARRGGRRVRMRDLRLLGGRPARPSSYRSLIVDRRVGGRG